MDRLLELVRLHRMGTGAREVSRLLQMSPNTERDYRVALQAEGLLQGVPDALPSLEILREAVRKHHPAAALPAQQISRIQQWSERISALSAVGLKPRAIHARLQSEESDFRGSYAQVKRLWRTLRRQQGPRAEEVAIPVETAAGQIAQVDFGYVGKLLDPESGRLREAWCFVMVLGFSRRMTVRVVFDQRTETWLRLHVEAFEEWGGVPETVVPDNLKAAVIRAAFSVSGPPSELNRSYRELARHYGFKIDPTPPYDAPKKGKVEAGVKYVKYSFFRGREGQPIHQVRAALIDWLAHVANVRVHGSTQQVPQELFDTEERAALLALPSRPFEPAVWKKATVHRDAHVAFDRRLYSVPWRLMNQAVWIRATAHTVCVYADDVRVATHARRGPGSRSTQDEHLPEHRVAFRHRSREYWEQRADQLGPEVGEFIREVFEADRELSQLRVVQAMVTYLEKVPPERAAAACRRASFFASYGYLALKHILQKGLDREPLPTPVVATGGALQSRFARSIRDLLHEPLEVHDEPH
jgi:transposase